MDTTQYWPFAGEYSVWNAAVTPLQFWMEDLEPHVFSNAIEWVCTAFFCSNSAQQLRNISEEVLFSCFVTTLNNTFEWELAQGDEGYESGSESLNIPTPQWRAPGLYQDSTRENLSFNPATPLTTIHPHPAHSPQRLSSHNLVHQHLTFGSSDEENPSPDSSPSHGQAEQSHLYSNTWFTTTHLYQAQMTPSRILPLKKKKKDFPTAPLDADVWLGDPVPVRYLWIHKESQPHYQCPYPSPYSLDPLHSAPEDAQAPYYEMMDLSDILNFQDVMTATSDEDIPDLDDILELWIWTMVWIKHVTHWTLWNELIASTPITMHSTC